METKTQILVFLVFLTVLPNAIVLVVFGASPASADEKKGDSVSILLDCGGTSSEVDSDGRKWEPDTKYMGKSDKSVPSTAQFQDPSLPSVTPYMSARIFPSLQSYSVKITAEKRHWLRLHFYPAVYGDYNPDDAYFDVIANGVTLLKNFSASVTAKALTQAYIIKEFSCFPASNGILNITFIPTSTHKGAYAFVNGIEVVSMPEIFGTAAMVGFVDQKVDTKGSTLQTMYRLNVGGNYIPASNDSGFSRTWYDDTPYLFGASEGITFEKDNNSKIMYPKEVPEYIAPADVYSTGRAMGPDNKVNTNYNLTWAFTVDANYTYIVRLHFAELEMDKVNKRVFFIYINNQTVDSEFDVILKAGGKNVAYYEDYATFVKDGPGDEQLFIALHPNTASKPEFYDAELNGVEIFKVNDTSGNLAGPNPVPSPMMLLAEEENVDDQNSNQNVKLIGGAAGGAAAVGLVAAVCIVVYQRKKRVLGNECGSSGWLPLYGGSYTSNSKSTISGKSSTSSSLSTLAAGLCRHFSLPEIRHGTRNFEESGVIGVGGFGKVYKGVVDGGLKVAIKRANPSSDQGVHEFRTEIEMLSKLRHRHLVSLIGFCEEDDEMILVYDYMAYGTLREHLYKNNKHHLSWKQRLEICIGAARGLHYLHTGAKYTIIHRDVKTTNILLDENWVAKVSDFGLSKTGPALNQTHVSTVVKGSFGYLDPEYFRRQQLTDKSDVYSFGVVLFEVLCARPALNPSLPKEQVSLADWALRCQRKGTLEDIIDPQLKGKINPECLKKFAECAEKCLSDSGLDRPSMGDVLWNLEFCLQLLENTGGAKPVDEGNYKPAQIRAHEATLSLDDNSLCDDSESTDAAFSMIVNPAGR